MKKKTLIIYYIITFILSIISLYSFKNRGNDFFTATAAITADFALIISVVLFIYALFYACDYIKDKISKKDKSIKKKVIISLSILLLTMTIIFISLVHIYSHKNIITFMYNSITKNENLDIILLFIKSIVVYFLLYLITTVGIIISYNHENDSVYKYLLISFASIIGMLIIKYFLGIRLLYLFIGIDIVIYILVNKLLDIKKRTK